MKVQEPDKGLVIAWGLQEAGVDLTTLKITANDD
jgi:hypothetical protein